MADNLKSASVLGADLQAGYDRLLADYKAAISEIETLNTELANSYFAKHVAITAFAGFIVGWLVALLADYKAAISEIEALNTELANSSFAKHVAITAFAGFIVGWLVATLL